ncbi:MAG: N-acyl homoserine lactone hydrolase [Pseudonocardiales bacterium]|nr:N-acyl homoserine lactone hydrolase [Pseudonocardiales bacterium]
MAGVREIVLLTLGWEELPKSVSVYGAPEHERLREPVPGVLLRCDGGWLLLDTGFNTALIRDLALRRRYHGREGYRAVLPGPGEPIEEALDAVGIDIGEIYAVGLSHLHLDHAGGLKLFAGRVPVHTQRRELEYGLSDHPDPERHAIYRVDFDDPAHDWRLADGDAEIAPGVTAVLTAGHTPGHQSFVVDLDDSIGGGGYVFAFDAADLTENIEHELPIGGTVHVHPSETVEPIRRLKAIAAEKGYPLVPGHDPVVWPELTARFADRFSSRATSGS